MKKTIFTILLSLFTLPCFAKGGALHFGVDQTVHTIDSVQLPEIDGTQFDLGYITETRFFIAGVYLIDKGYVLQVRHTDRYMPLDEKTITELQQDKILPTPMPSYQISWFSYALGFSLWIIIAVLILWGLISSRLKRR